MLSKRLINLLGILVILLAGSVALLGGRVSPDHFPNIELMTQDGKKVHFYDDLIKDKIVAINLIYTHCQYSCPLETARLAQVQRILGDRVGKDIFFYSISIDPEHDTPAELKAYAEKYHAGPGWTFLTGKKDDIDFLSKKLGLYSDPAATVDGHTPHLLIGNEATGQWMRNSALDNPRFMSQMIGDFLDNYKNVKPQPEKVTEAAKLNFDKGQYVFARECAACHTVGQGDKIGPDLLGITNARNRDWLVRMIQRPDLLLEEKDPLATTLFKKYNQVLMPNLRLDDEEVNAVIGYLVSQSSHQNPAEHANEANAMGAGGQAKPNR